MSPYDFLTKIRAHEQYYYRQIRDWGVYSSQLKRHRQGDKDAWEYLKWLANTSGRYKYDVDFSDVECMEVVVMDIETIDQRVFEHLQSKSFPVYLGQRPGGRKLRALPQQLLLLL